MESETKPKNIPTVFIIFGATGDLMAKKIVPALFNLYKKDKLPKLFKIIGFSRRSWNTPEFQSYIHGILKKHVDTHRIKGEDFIPFLEYFIYHEGDFEKIASYKKLAEFLGHTDGEWKVCSNKLFYLAVPPASYKTIFEHLAASALTVPCSPEEGFTRVVVEKPFGNDFETAQKLDTFMGRLFKEDQLYRIDHYLAKEMLQNILSFRFGNNLFEKSWNNDFIEKIEIKLLENVGVEGRGKFYDGVGALRDVGQNHLLQMLALLTMDQPKSFEAKRVRKERFNVLNKLEALTPEKIKQHTFRAQYKGYRKITGVKPNSDTETYFKVVTHINSPRWEGVPIILESGKELPRRKEILVTFKHPQPCLCPPGIHYQNKIIFELEPKEQIVVEFWAKIPGLEYALQKQTLTYLYRDQRKKAQYIEEYEKLLLDCITGNQLLFMNTEEVLAMWKFIDPIICAWQENVVPLHMYESDKRKILQESLSIEVFDAPTSMKRQIGVIGLGKMGGNIARRLVEKEWRVVAYNRTETDTKDFEKEGGTGAYTLEELVSKLAKPRTILLSLPAGSATEDMIERLLPLLDRRDILIDGANGYYKDSVRYANKTEKKGVYYLDAGISGGPGGARAGACIMVGGDKKIFNKVKLLFYDMAQENGVQFFEGYGAGHFVKMVHNGIEYGMMQSLAEGFEIMKKSKYNLNLTKITDLYNHGSVIESRLVGWLQNAFIHFGEDLKNVSPHVPRGGEGDWTVKTAKELNVAAKVIEDAVKFRVKSEKKATFAGKVLNGMRNMFGGHSIK